MRRFISLSTLAIGLAWIGNAVAVEYATAGFYDHYCHMPAQFRCWGCAVACPADKVAVCRAGMNIWGGKAWSCAFQPKCACQKTMWRP